MIVQTFQGQAAEARQQAAAAQADAAAAAREAAAAAREQARAQAQELRDRVNMIRDVDQLRHMARTGVITVPPFEMNDRPTPRQEKMLFAGFVILVIAAVVILQPVMRALGRRLEDRGRRADGIDAGSAERLQRIEQAVDAMAIEIERISEGQRFTTRLLSSRAEAPVSLEG